MKKLPERQQRFCMAYIRSLNSAQAAIEAGYSNKTARTIGSKLLTNIDIQREVEKLKQKVAKRLDITTDKIVQELAKIGYFNIQELLESDNSIKDISKIPKEHAAAVESIKTVTRKRKFKDGPEEIETTVTVKVFDKVSALEKLARHTGAFEKDNDQSRPVANIDITRTVIHRELKQSGGDTKKLEDGE